MVNAAVTLLIITTVLFSSCQAWFDVTTNKILSDRQKKDRSSPSTAWIAVGGAIVTLLVCGMPRALYCVCDGLNRSTRYRPPEPEPMQPVVSAVPPAIWQNAVNPNSDEQVISTTFQTNERDLRQSINVQTTTAATTTESSCTTARTVGLENIVLSRLENDSLACPVCLDQFSKNVQAVFLPCAHVLHFACLQMIFAKDSNSKCPICRHDIDFKRWNLRIGALSTNTCTPQISRLRLLQYTNKNLYCIILPELITEARRRQCRYTFCWVLLQKSIWSFGPGNSCALLSYWKILSWLAVSQAYFDWYCAASFFRFVLHFENKINFEII